jgi:hypothetical protein
MVADDSRPRGTLTEADRKFLKASESEREEEYTRQSRTNARRRIQERIKMSILDFSIILENLSEEERREIFTTTPEDSAAFRDGITGFIGLVFTEALANPTLLRFESLVRRGIERAYRKMSGSQEVRVGVELDWNAEPMSHNHLDEIEAKVEAGEWDDLTESELKAFLRFYSWSDEFDPAVPRQMFDEGAGGDVTTEE